MLFFIEDNVDILDAVLLVLENIDGQICGHVSQMVSNY